MKRVISVALLIALIMVPFQVFAQDGPQMETYTSDDGLFSASYPSDWKMMVDDTLPFPNLVLLNSDEALTRWNSDENPASGDAAIYALLLPVDFLSLLDIQLPDEYGVTDLANAFATLLMEPVSPDDPLNDLVINQAEEIHPNDDELVAGYVMAKDSISEGSVIAREFDGVPGVVAVVVALTPPDEYSDGIDAIALGITTSLEFTGTADSLMNSILGISDTGDSGSTGATSATLDGATLVAERCTVCHDTQRIDSRKMNEAAWTNLVDEMISFGAELNSAERQAVIDYLVATHS